MFRFCLSTALLGVAAVVAHAGEDDAALTTAYDRLLNGLQEEVQILASITDTATAQAAVSSLKANAAALARRVDGVTDKALWNYIDNTQDNKLPLIEMVQRLSAQLTRLQKANFFGCYELQDALRPQLEPNPDKMRD